MLNFFDNVRGPFEESNLVQHFFRLFFIFTGLQLQLKFDLSILHLVQFVVLRVHLFAFPPNLLFSRLHRFLQCFDLFRDRFPFENILFLVFDELCQFCLQGEVLYRRQLFLSFERMQGTLEISVHLLNLDVEYGELLFHLYCGGVRLLVLVVFEFFF